MTASLPTPTGGRDNGAAADRDALISGALQLIRDSAPTQTEWAQRIGVSRTAISHWLNDRATPTVENAFAIVAAATGLGVHPDRVDPLLALVPSHLIVRSEKAVERPDGASAMDSPRLERLVDSIQAVSPVYRRTVLAACQALIDGFLPTPAEHAAPLADLVTAAAATASQRDREHVLRALARDVSELSEQARAASAGLDYVKWVYRDAAYVLSVFRRATLALGDGHTYDTISNLDFWSTYTLSSRRDFLTTQDRAAKDRGVRIRRLILIAQETILSDGELLHLEEQARFKHLETRALLVPEVEIGGIGNFVVSGPSFSEDAALYELTFRRLPLSEARALERISVTADTRKIAEKRAAFDALFHDVESRPLPDLLRSLREPRPDY